MSNFEKATRRTFGKLQAVAKAISGKQHEGEMAQAFTGFAFLNAVKVIYEAGANHRPVSVVELELRALAHSVEGEASSAIYKAFQVALNELRNNEVI